MLSTWLKNEDMKSSCQKEEAENKKGYVFFSDPDVIVKRAETVAIEAQIRRDFEAQQQVFEKQSINLPAPSSGIKNLESLLSYHPVQPYPFTFISAVKQKLALGTPSNNSTETYSNLQAKSNLISPVLKTNCKQNPYQIVQKMDFFKPLKVPDLKISPKTLDFSSRENSISKELPSTKSEIAVKELSHERLDKATKVNERVQRKLDFSASDGSSAINCESIEPLKAPNVSIASNLSKKKEHTHIRDSSREKENRSKRIKKDDSLCAKKDESAQDQVKRSRSPRHVSRRDMVDSMNSIITTRLKNDRIPFHTTKNIDSLSTKSKVKTFVTSTAKKDNEKRQRSFNAQSVELAKDIPLESKGRTCSSKVPDSVLWKVPDKVTTRDNSSMMVLSSNTENKPKDICHLRQVEDLKYKCDSDNRLLKQDKPNTIHKEQTKRISEKGRTLSNKIEEQTHSAISEPSEDIECMSETNSSKNRINVYPINSVQQSKSGDSETMIENKQNINSIRSAKIAENFKYAEHSVTQSTSATATKDEELYSQSITTTGQTTINDDTNDVDVTILPEELFDPRRISFRDNSYSQQEEFHNLTTPDKLDFIPRFKQRKYLIQSSDSEVDARCPKYKSTTKAEKEQEKTQLRHPEALRMTLQAECEFFESLNEAYKNTKEVEKCFYHNMKREQEQKNPQVENEKDEEIQVEESRVIAAVDNDFAENATWKPLNYAKKDIANTRKLYACDDMHFIREHYASNQASVDETNDNFKAKIIKVAEVQTQTVNDIATQTDTYVGKRNAQNKLSDIPMYERSSLGENERPHLSLDSADQFEDLDQVEGTSVTNRITMSEISVHETTSSIKTETGNEISISTRDLTCLIRNKEFKKYLQLHLAQLIKDEKQRYDRLEMLFKDHEKSLNDRTRKLVQLEEEKRALRDTGQDSLISSVKKKQRALLLKLKEEKDEMNRLKELHEIASQERKLMLQKQRDMFNPQLSTKNILTKLKRSADSQSPRRLSGPMKGYDIRSNSSISSLIDSDKSQHDRSQADARLQASESDIHLSKPDLAKSDKCENLAEESNTSATRFDDLVESNESHEESSLKPQKKNDVSKYESKSRKYEEKMPKADILRQKQNQLDLESKRIQSHSMNIKRLLENQKSFEMSSSSVLGLDALITDHVKSESDTLVEELSKKSKTSQIVDPFIQTATVPKEKELAVNIIATDSKSIEEEIDSEIQDIISKATKSSQVCEDILQTNNTKNSKKIDKSVTSDRDHISKKLQHSVELKTSSKRKSSKHQKAKSSSSALTENLSRFKSTSHASEKPAKHYDKRTKLDLNESQDSLEALVRHSKEVKDKNLKLLNETINDYESKENISSQASNRKFETNERPLRNEQTVQNISTSQISALPIYPHSSEESEKNMSVVLRSQDRNFKAKKFGQILTARETALASRKNTVEDWMAWHTRLRAEEERVNRMEQAALKIVAATSNVLSQQDTTVSSDMSDVEGRIEILTEKLAERRMEMSRLKKEARKQAKQRLRAMEANLLNQIKRYDTTIHEMRKKLESKKAIKDSDKLAIEPKSLADFKVPEIPLKRIQDIYKSSDLLRSRSESDLLTTRNQQRDLLKIVTAAIYDDRHEKNSSQQSVRSTDIRSANASELKSTTNTNHTAQSMFEEYTLTEVNSKPQTATSVSSNDAGSERYNVLASDTVEKQLEESVTIETKQDSISRDAEDIQTIINTVRSELEAQTISDIRSSKNRSTISTESENDKVISHTSIDYPQSKALATQSEILEEIDNVDYSKSIPSKSDYATERVAASNQDALTFSEKLDFLQLNNKNLNENISSLENGLKVLSEIMSRFSNKTDKESKIDNDEKSTSQDISEIMSKSVFSDRVIPVEREGQEAISSEREINTESPSNLTSDRRSKSSNDLSHDKYTSEKADNDISAIIPEVTPALSNSAYEIDYEAKSREIMNEIEKSILSEHNKVIRGDYNVSSVLENDMQNLRKDNEELLNDLISLELDVKSISQILSKVSESRRSLNLATNTTTQIIDHPKENASAQSDLNKASVEENSVKDQVSATHSSKSFEQLSIASVHSPIIAGHRSKESNETNLHSALTNQTSRIAISEDYSKSSEKIPELPGIETSIIDDMGISSNLQRVKDIQTSMVDNTVNSTTTASNVERDRSRTISTSNVSQDKDDWTTSDSFEMPESKISTGVAEEEQEDSESESSRSHLDHMHDTSNSSLKERNISRIEAAINQNVEVSSTSYVDMSAFIPKGESTNIEASDITFANIIAEPHVMKSNDELDDILDIIARENNQKESIPDNENEKFNNIICNSVTDLLEKVEDIGDNNEATVSSHLKGIPCNNEIDIPTDERSEAVSIFNDEMQNRANIEDISDNNIDSASKSNDDKSINRQETIDFSPRAVNETGDKSSININLHVAIDNEESLREAISEGQEIIITELDSDSVDDHVLPELEIDAKIELAEDVSANDANEKQSRGIAPVEIQECLEPILEQDSSDGEQLDNLVEVAESGLDTVEKVVIPPRASVESAADDEEVSIQAQGKTTDNVIDANTSVKNKSDNASMLDEPIVDNINKTFDILKDPDYEDISEESLEVSEILDKNELSKTNIMKKSTNLPEKYQATQRSDEVLRILDEISQKSSPDFINNSSKDEKDTQSTTEEISEVLGAEVSTEDNVLSLEPTKAKDKIEEEFYENESKGRFMEEAVSRKKQPPQATNEIDLAEEKSIGVYSKLNEGLQEDKSQIIYELHERVSQLQEQDGSSESSEAGDTPKGVSEIEMDSPRDFNDSRLDIDILDDDLLSGTKAVNQNVDMKSNFHSASIVTTSEKDIEAMIYKLKASLEQPGLEVAELEAKLLHIEQLEIELEIKKLEAEEVSYYVREIPNKPPPPYTPPEDGRLSSSLGSPSLLTAVIPSNVEELTSFTEKATALIYNAKIAGEDVASLEAPPEIYELSKEKNEIVRKDRRIYNSFLFDLCKETVAEVYRAEYEKPGPSWTKPNVKTKPTVKIPKTVEELTEYVGKEVATLFGFKTKLQRENMVMRWSRKRRDRVDELLAREAQAEEDEWTKFHHDELAVKNGLAVTILDTLVMETANIVKLAYGKKRRLMVSIMDG
ncbi:golgin subfamily B member 1 [Harpegnathos saltator]|uniref:Centrosome-associated protein 350 n=1 Tax=Harpegnathos saltator TaxID=610380 RepID=E2C023_HARSA|nr:golgin subfamily B member 1 [Harpegnathos saltator]XP_019699353.1 golgin subfamily B member 1 [Harpegnathos saltator]EFN78719.1 Centrosome-associated protein 350 [Harpegnathos saltator]